MTIIIDGPQDRRAKRPNKPMFRPDGGPLPHGKPSDLHINARDRDDQSSTGNRDYSRHTLRKLRLPFPERYQDLRQDELRRTTSDRMRDIVRRSRNGGYRPFFRRTT
jgi:hypothetical protein